MVNITRKTKKHIQHHHLLIRMESILYPSKNDIPMVNELIRRIIKKLNMKIIDIPHIYYVDKPSVNKGITGITAIQTSHVSFHIWETPEESYLLNNKSKALLQFDVYTCGYITRKDVLHVIKELGIFIPTRIDVDLLNRKKALNVDYTLRWNDTYKLCFNMWLKSLISRQSSSQEKV
jgi:S-adenosylmethionine/arginine decarboxylase-like enzyme